LSHSKTKLFAAAALLLLAAWLRWRSPLDVPPGLGMDELIANQISEGILDGDWRVFYPAGQGREPAFNYWLAAWQAFLGQRVFTLRVASSALSLLGLSAVYLLMRRLFNPAVALVNLAFGATSFWTIFAARAGARSVSMIPFAALAAYLFWRGLDVRSAKPPLRSLRFMAGAGLCLGLTFYTFTAARVLPAVFVLFALYLLLFHRPGLTGRWVGLLLGALIVLLVLLPLLHYLFTHPQADQLGFREWDRPLTALLGGDLKPALQTSLDTLKAFSFQGDPLIFDNVPGRPIFEPLSAILFLIGVGIALVRFHQPAYAFILIWLLVSLVPGMLSQPAPNFYRIVGAQVVAFAFPALAVVEGWRFLHQHWLRPRWQRRGSISLAGGLALILIIHLATSWRAYFVTWPTVEGVSFFWQTGLAEAAHYLDAAPDDNPVALCTVLTYEHDPWWRPAWQSMPYLLRRSDLEIRYYDCRTTAVLPAGESVRYLFPDPSAPLSLLPETLRGAWVARAKPIPEPLSPEQVTILHLDDPPQTMGPTPGEARWAPEEGGESAALPVAFGATVALQGYQLIRPHPRPGEAVQLVTSWEVLATPPPRLVLFTHLLADPQTLVAQQDSLALTSHALRPGDRFLVLHDQIWIPADLPADQLLLLSIGVYNSDTMIRLPLSERNQQRGDRLFLAPVSLGQ
jgi:4-amino-4-deoxy-L-arabinose transferase-like glycosyltransferase